MDFPIAAKSPGERYKLMTGIIVPRPIALITTLNPNGTVNIAPFSYYNAMMSDPPLVVLGIGNRDRTTPKDTAANLRRTGECVIHTVTEEIADKMNLCAIDFPASESELNAADFTTAPAIKVKPPLLVESPIKLECREHQTIEMGAGRIILVEILHVHIRDDLYDADKGYVQSDQIQAIGRMHGAGAYTRTRDLFTLQRKTYQEWQNQSPESPSPS